MPASVGLLPNKHSNIFCSIVIICFFLCSQLRSLSLKEATIYQNYLFIEIKKFINLIMPENSITVTLKTNDDVNELTT